MLEGFHPIVRRWFEQRLGRPTEPQVRAWPEVARATVQQLQARIEHLQRTMR